MNKNPWDHQEGGGHYKGLAIQPMQYSLANKLDAAQHTAIKYVTRFREKGGIADLRKAIHTIELLIAHEEAEATKHGNTELSTAEGNVNPVLQDVGARGTGGVCRHGIPQAEPTGR